MNHLRLVRTSRLPPLSLERRESVMRRLRLEMTLSKNPQPNAKRLQKKNQKRYPRNLPQLGKKVTMATSRPRVTVAMKTPLTMTLIRRRASHMLMMIILMSKLT